MNRNLKRVLFWVVAGFLTVGLVNFYENRRFYDRHTISFSDFVTKTNDGQVHEVSIRGEQVTGRFNDGTFFTTNVPFQDRALIDRLMAGNVKIHAKPSYETTPSIFQVLLSWLPMIVLAGIWIFFMRQMQGGVGKALRFGRSKAKKGSDDQNKITFADVAGIDEAKKELAEVVNFLKSPDLYRAFGAKIPKGVLLVGPPGTGKTLLARAVAGEADVPFLSVSGSDFVEMFVGVGAGRVRDLFKKAKESGSSVIFIDEIDAVGRQRGTGLGGGNDEREQTLNAILVEMDGFEANESVVVIAATNRPDVLDPALVRPGRFDRQITVPAPDLKGRREILMVHMKKLPLHADVDPLKIARGTNGFSGADLANLVNEAAIAAASEDIETQALSEEISAEVQAVVSPKMVHMRHFEWARERLILGPKRPSMMMDDEEKTLTAYHEAGHCLVAIKSEGNVKKPIHKITIAPRGNALGMVVRFPERDPLSMHKNELEAELAVLMAGRLAEEMVFGLDKITTGASNDIKVATQLARRMVTQWGMSDKLGPMMYEEPAEHMFLGNSVLQQKHVSDATATIIDEEIRRVLIEAYDRARAILTNNADAFKLLAKTLLEQETLSGRQVQVLLEEGRLIEEDEVSGLSPSNTPAPSVEVPAVA